MDPILRLTLDAADADARCVYPLNLLLWYLFFEGIENFDIFIT